MPIKFIKQLCVGGNQFLRIFLVVQRSAGIRRGKRKLYCLYRSSEILWFHKEKCWENSITFCARAVNFWTMSRKICEEGSPRESLAHTPLRARTQVRMRETSLRTCANMRETRTHTNMYARGSFAHTHLCANSLVHTHLYAPLRTHRQVYAHTPTYTRKHTHARTHARTRSHARIYM